MQNLSDLLEYFPRAYQQESAECPIGNLTAGPIHTVRGTVVAVNYVAYGRPRFEATIIDDSGTLALVWFNGAYLRTRIHPGILLRVRGKVRFFRGIPQMAQPKWEIVDDSTATLDAANFRPIYPATAKLPSQTIEKIIEANLPDALQKIQEWFDPDLLKRRSLVGRSDAYQMIHRPRDLREARQARRRLVYDELMLLQLALALSKRLRHGKLSAPVLRIDKLLDERIRARFPFTMTSAQQRATWEIVRDMQSGQPMNRLLQGDVGSGKTAVALYAMLAAVANKLQAAILAPTEVLAEQHYLNLSNLLRDSSVTIELFTGRTRRQSRKLWDRLSEGVVHLAVGTQALIQQGVEFANLGLVVVDEQHKLGVRQRGVLKGKGLSPHYLVMTATPIPRTLALSYFADFDVSVIDELPPGRQPIHTRWLHPQQAIQAYDFVRQQVHAGHQAYIVLPQVQEDDLREGGKAVMQEVQRLAKGPLAGLRLAPLHGQMSTDEKQAAMLSFRDRQTDVLVATTVIEVGIDVPNATVMLIDNAERFGLSQLHQLRGRVGRGAAQSHCILIADPLTESASSRMQAMTRTSDGFEIAQMDLELRGPGEFFGLRQHGLPELKLADISSELELLHTAREDALALLKQDPTLAEHQPLRRRLLDQFGTTLELAQIG